MSPAVRSPSWHYLARSARRTESRRASLTVLERISPDVAVEDDAHWTRETRGTLPPSVRRRKVSDDLMGRPAPGYPMTS